MKPSLHISSVIDNIDGLGFSNKALCELVPMQGDKCNPAVPGFWKFSRCRSCISTAMPSGVFQLHIKVSGIRVMKSLKEGYAPKLIPASQ